MPVGGTNPFDDTSFEDSKATTNPFDQEQPHHHATAATATATTNPFDNNNNNNNNRNPSGKDSDSNDDEAATSGNDTPTAQQQQQQHQLFLNPSTATGSSAAAASTADAVSSAAAVSPPAEASWQYLGDLPYRRVPIYSNVHWMSGGGGGGHSYEEDESRMLLNRSHHHGLASFSPAALKQHQLSKSSMLTPREVRQLLANTTRTLVSGCPHGGPVACITCPLVVTAKTSTTSSAAGGVGSAANNNKAAAAAAAAAAARAELRILTNSGILLASIDFPPPPPPSSSSSQPSSSLSPRHHLHHEYTAADVLTIGFTSRALLVVVMKDSLIYVYNMKGELVFNPPFYALPKGGSSSSSSSPGDQHHAHHHHHGSGGYELLQAHVYDGGVAVLARNKNSAIVELFDEYDDVEYMLTAHISARRICGRSGSSNDLFLDGGGPTCSTESSAAATSPHHYALITPLPTAVFADRNLCHYVCLAVLPRSRTTSKHPEVFLSTSDNSVAVVNASTCDIVDVNCRSRINSPIVDMCFAPNGRFLACFTESSMLTVISTSFETKVLDFDTSEGSSSPPNTMVWCGEDSVLLHWNKLGVLMVGPYGDWLRFPFDGHDNVYLIPEIDCCRVLTDNSVEILQRVPPATALLLRIGSIETSAMLLDAADAFYSGQPTSEEAVQAIIQTGMLNEAIETCTNAAAREFDIVTQKRLLRAASFGMHFHYKNDITSNGDVDGYDDGKEEKDNDNYKLGITVGGPLSGSPFDSGLLPSTTTVQFVNTAKKLRVLNALRNPKVGFLLTTNQYDDITSTGVIARLVAMNRASLASEFAKYLNLSKSVRLFARASKAAALVEMAAADSSSPGTLSGHSDTEIAEAAICIINEDLPLKQRQQQQQQMMSRNSSKRLQQYQRNNNSATTIRSRGGYATVAMTASKVGRTGVANLLLMLETSVADKIPCLIANGSYADAIAVATYARDADFIFSTLMEYEKACMLSSPSGSAAAGSGDVSKAQATFLSTVVTKFTPESFHTLRKYLMVTMSDIKSVTNLLLRAQKFTDAGAAMALRALSENDLREKQGILSEASRVFGLGKETALYKSCTDDYLELLKDQEVLRTKYGSNDVVPSAEKDGSPSSVTATISSVIHFAARNLREQHRLLSDADKIAKKFRVSEKRLWHIKVKAFADSQQWSNLRLLADSKGTKSPIGYKPFARAAIKAKQPKAEILKYIERVTLSEEKYDLYCEAKLWKNALEEAGARLKDPRRVLNVKNLCNSSELQLMADQLLARMA